MNPETIANITRWLTLITMAFAVVGSIGIIATAVYQTLVSRRVRWDALLFALVLLWALPYGIRIYGPELVDATIDLLNNLAGKRAPLEDAITRFIGDANEQLPIVPEVPTSPVVIDTTQPTIIITSTPWPTPEGVIIAVPQPTQPTQPTPTPTKCVAMQSGDLERGCVPPTPVPGR